MAYTDSFPVVPNFFETSLTAPASSMDTDLYLLDVSALPNIIEGKDFIPMILSNGTQREVVYIRSIDTAHGLVRVTRAEEATDAIDWPDLTYVYVTMTADALQRIRVNGFCPVYDGQGNRPKLRKASLTSFTIPGDWTDKLEPNTAVRLLSTDGVVEPTDKSIGAIHLTTLFYADGVTTVGVRNAVIPDNISGLDVGMQKSSSPLYTPDTVYADGVTLEQNGNIISAPVATTSRRGIVNANDIVSLVKATILDAAYPVGAVYISTVATSPAALFGGTWTSLGGRFLLGADATYRAGTTGGEAKHALSAAEMPKHTHSASTDRQGDHNHNRGNMEIWGAFGGNEFIRGYGGAFTSSGGDGSYSSTGGAYMGHKVDFYASRSWTGVTNTAGGHTHNVSIGNEGNSEAHNNMPPYLSVYMWKRTA